MSWVVSCKVYAGTVRCFAETEPDLRTWSVNRHFWDRCNLSTRTLCCELEGSLTSNPISENGAKSGCCFKTSWQFLAFVLPEIDSFPHSWWYAVALEESVESWDVNYCWGRTENLAVCWLWMLVMLHEEILSLKSDDLKPHSWPWSYSCSALEEILKPSFFRRIQVRTTVRVNSTIGAINVYVATIL